MPFRRAPSCATGPRVPPVARSARNASVGLEPTIIPAIADRAKLASCAPALARSKFGRTPDHTVLGFSIVPGRREEEAMHASRRRFLVHASSLAALAAWRRTVFARVQPNLPVITKRVEKLYTIP